MGLKQQRGMTFIGLLMVASVAGVLIVSGLNILPLYLQDQKMSTIFKSLEKDGEGGMSRVEIVKFIQNRMDINQIESDQVDLGGIEVEGTPGGGKRVRLEYEARAPLMGNLDAVATFHHEVIVR
ncbi:MAG: DUF4845 domain-containing protein [Halothiobacillaceae bacterium]|jgi:hypothetical protein|nr:MAG: DUF4845 domain-containing protein [Halothiobacillaceae bacterium]